MFFVLYFLSATTQPDFLPGILAGESSSFEHLSGLPDRSELLPDQCWEIEGGKVLAGTVAISGAKNAAIKLACAALLTDEWVHLSNVPQIGDMLLICQILQDLGVEINRNGDKLSLRAHKLCSHRARYDLVRKMRGSFVLLGPMLARFGRAEISLPGGCNLGVRPVDIHLNGLRAMGANIELEDGYVIATGKLHGAEIFPHCPTVTGTENLVMAATAASHFFLSSVSTAFMSLPIAST